MGKWCADWQLSLSLDKCFTLQLGRTLTRPANYSTHNLILPTVGQANDLGVIIDSKLRFTSHYSSMVAKAHQRAALILRCFKSRDPILLFKAFTTYVRPIVEYCSPVWSPVYKTDITLIESVQRRFTKKLFGLRELSYTQPLESLNADSLEKRRLKLDLITMFKIAHNIVDLNVSDFFTFDTTGRTRGGNTKLFKPRCNVNIRAHSFACRRVNCWNSLPTSVREAINIYSFKQSLNKCNLNAHTTLSIDTF